MTLKKASMRKGRQLKRELGLDHVTAMAIGKLLVRGRTWEIGEKFPQCIRHTTCGDKCCSFTHIVGPKGKLEI